MYTFFLIFGLGRKMNTFSLSICDVKQTMLSDAQRNVHIPLKICLGRKMNTFSLNNVETLRQSITNWYAQRNAHFPLNICWGQENEHIFLKKMLLNIQSVDNRLILPRRMHTFFLIFVWGRKMNTFSFTYLVRNCEPRGMHTFFISCMG